MPITLSDLKLYYSLVDPDDDTVLQIGGAIDRTKRPAFSDVSGLVQIVSSTSVDTTQQVTVFGRDTGGAIVSEAKTLTGITPNGLVQSFERLLKGIKNALTVGDIAVEAQSATLTGNNQGTTLFDVTLPLTASDVDGFYNQQIYRQTGTNKGIRRIINYIGASRLATFDHPFLAFIGPSAGDNVTGSGDAFRMGRGEFFERLPIQVIQIRRPFYNAAADAAGGVTRKYYSKMFWENTNGQGLTLTSAQAIEASDPVGNIAFALETLFNGVGTNGAGNNRQVAPTLNVTTFDSVTKNLPGGSQDLRSGSHIGLWLELTLAAAAPAQNTTYTPRLQGQTS